MSHYNNYTDVLLPHTSQLIVFKLHIQMSNKIGFSMKITFI